MDNQFPLRDILRSIQTPVGNILARREESRWYLQIEGPAGRGRKWWLSPHMTTSEVVRTAFMASMAYNEHELREAFTFDGKAIFGPHIDVHALVSVWDQQDRRPGSPGAWERESLPVGKDWDEEC